VAQNVEASVEAPRKALKQLSWLQARRSSWTPASAAVKNEVKTKIERILAADRLGLTKICSFETLVAVTLKEGDALYLYLPRDQKKTQTFDLVVVPKRLCLFRKNFSCWNTPTDNMFSSQSMLAIPKVGLPNNGLESNSPLWQRDSPELPEVWVSS
jgi:hypothetical protein